MQFDFDKISPRKKAEGLDLQEQARRLHRGFSPPPPRTPRKMPRGKGGGKSPAKGKNNNSGSEEDDQIYRSDYDEVVDYVLPARGYGLNVRAVDSKGTPRMTPGQRTSESFREVWQTPQTNARRAMVAPNTEPVVRDWKGVNTPQQPATTQKAPPPAKTPVGARTAPVGLFGGPAPKYGIGQGTDPVRTPQHLQTPTPRPTQPQPQNWSSPRNIDFSPYTPRDTRPAINSDTEESYYASSSSSSSSEDSQLEARRHAARLDARRTERRDRGTADIATPTRTIVRPGLPYPDDYTQFKIIPAFGRDIPLPSAYRPGGTTRFFFSPFRISDWFLYKIISFINAFRPYIPECSVFNWFYITCTYPIIGIPLSALSIGGICLAIYTYILPWLFSIQVQTLAYSFILLLAGYLPGKPQVAHSFFSIAPLLPLLPWSTSPDTCNMCLGFSILMFLAFMLTITFLLRRRDEQALSGPRPERDRQIRTWRWHFFWFIAGCLCTTILLTVAFVGRSGGFWPYWMPDQVVRFAQGGHDTITNIPNSPKLDTYWNKPVVALFPGGDKLKSTVDAGIPNEYTAGAKKAWNWVGSKFKSDGEKEEKQKLEKKGWSWSKKGREQKSSPEQDNSKQKQSGWFTKKDSSSTTDWPDKTASTSGDSKKKEEKTTAKKTPEKMDKTSNTPGKSTDKGATTTPEKDKKTTSSTKEMEAKNTGSTTDEAKKGKGEKDNKNGKNDKNQKAEKKDEKGEEKKSWPSWGGVKKKDEEKKDEKSSGWFKGGEKKEEKGSRWFGSGDKKEEKGKSWFDRGKKERKSGGWMDKIKSGVDSVASATTDTYKKVKEAAPNIEDLKNKVTGKEKKKGFLKWGK